MYFRIVIEGGSSVWQSTRTRGHWNRTWSNFPVPNWHSRGTASNKMWIILHLLPGLSRHSLAMQRWLPLWSGLFRMQFPFKDGLRESRATQLNNKFIHSNLNQSLSLKKWIVLLATPTTVSKAIPQSENPPFTCPNDAGFYPVSPSKCLHHYYACSAGIVYTLVSYLYLLAFVIQRNWLVHEIIFLIYASHVLTMTYSTP